MRADNAVRHQHHDNQAKEDHCCLSSRARPTFRNLSSISQPSSRIRRSIYDRNRTTAKKAIAIHTPA